ncbi:hypothetical protein WME75_07410 [Sorangium sp. So ce1014]|uniref:hypothetical protein n=1 Tax=Sorangium sp. So ce1014 TaxID=3133326 RepID=UPI003F5ED04B
MGRMRGGRGWLRSLAVIALGCGSAAGGAGCYAEDCATTFSCHPLPGETPPSLPGSPCDGDPATSAAKDECGVFVARRGDDASDGTREAPVRTLRRAVEKASEPGGTRRVYACAEDFEEAVTLPSGVAIWGGRDCSTAAWTWGGKDRFTEIAPEPERVPLTVEAREASMTSVVFGVRLVAADATRPSGSSIAMIVREGAAVDVVSSELLAGNGADGADGDDGAPRDQPWRAPDGVGGNPGAHGCVADWTEGAPRVVTLCEDGTMSIGGAGGEGDVAAGGDGMEGAPAPVSDSMERGEGGNGGAMSCTAGKSGGNGESGANGVGGGAGLPDERLKYGSISAHGWQGFSGQNGQNGGIGLGGGGGGGVGSNGHCRPVDPQSGPSGGSGGSGGCGGRGGRGGGYGGGSFGIIALHAHVLVDKTAIITGDGGRGGNAGTGQAGGRGRAGGADGRIDGTVYSACAGGNGGDGGKGGHGGGGLGGVSMAVARVDSSVHLTQSATWAWGEAGAGGLGGAGDPNDTIANGERGRTAPLWDFPELVVPPR